MFLEYLKNFLYNKMFFFFFTVLLVYFSESINEIASTNWHVFSRQQYFDSKGLFISVVFSMPILLNCMLMVVSTQIEIIIYFCTKFSLGKLVVSVNATNEKFKNSTIT